MDLRSYLAELAAKSPGSVERYPDAADWRRQPEADAAELASHDRWPVLWWDAAGVGSAGVVAGVAANLFADRSRMAGWFGVDADQLAHEMLKRLRKGGRVAVDASQAPVRQAIHQGSEVDLTALAVPRHGANQTTITGGLLIYHDPADGAERICQRRVVVTAPSALAIPLDHHDRFSRVVAEAAQRGERIEAALWIGHHPAALLAASCLEGQPRIWDDLSSMLGNDVPVAPSISFGDRLTVPAEAEVVIEGEIDPSSSNEIEGFPAGNGYVARATPAVHMQVRCIGHRAEALWCDVIPEQTDARNLASVAREVVLIDQVGRQAPSLLNAHIPPTGSGLHAYLQFREPRKGEAREAILCALAADTRLKHVFAVDDDINIFDDREVLWALATRSQWERDAITLPGLRGSRLDPLADGEVAAKGGFDCTRPAGEAYSERNAISPSVYSEVRIEDYINAAHLARIPVEHQ